MTLTLIRHGQTEGNLRHRYIGRTDQPLCQQGIETARKSSRDEGVQTVYVTPLRRTQETAAILFPAANQVILPQLREMDFGVFENRNTQEMEGDPQFQAWVDSLCQAPCPGGESQASFTNRVCTCFRQLAQDLAGTEQATLVVHGGTIMAILSAFAIPHRDYFDWRVKNCKGYRCQLTLDAEGSITLTQIEPWP